MLDALGQIHSENGAKTEMINKKRLQFHKKGSTCIVEVKERVVA